MYVCVCVCGQDSNLGSWFPEPLPLHFPLPVTQSLWTVGLSFLTQLLSSCESGRAERERRGGISGFHVPATSFSAKGEVDPFCT